MSPIQQKHFFMLTLQSAELQKDVFDMHQKVKRYKEHVHELESQLGEKEVTIAMYKEKVFIL